MMLFALALNSLLVILDDRLTGVTLGPIFSKFTGIAYADEVTVIVTCRTDVSQMAEAVTQYERAIGARLNYGKSKALPIGTWNTTDSILIIPYVQEVTILGIRFQNTLAGSIAGTWTQLVNSIRVGRKRCMHVI
jgi:hypothetical protein